MLGSSRRREGAWRYVLHTIAVSVCLLAVGCGGGGGQDNTPPSTRFGQVYPAEAGITFVEYDATGRTLQRSLPSDESGRFEFAKEVSGDRVVSTPATEAGTVPRLAIEQAARLSLPQTTLMVTPVTTLADQLVVNGQPREAARSAADRLARGACDPAVPTAASAPPRAASLDVAAMVAIDAFLHGLLRIGLSPRTPGIEWERLVADHSSTLGEMCAVTRAVFSDSWVGGLDSQLQQRVAGVRLANTWPQLRLRVTRQVLAKMAQRLAVLEHPQLRRIGGISAPLALGSELALAARLMAIELEHAASPASPGVAATAQAASAASTLGAGVDGNGEPVVVLRSSVEATATVPAMLRFHNNGSQDRAVKLSINDVPLADFPGLLNQLLAVPALTRGEPLWQRAWRYVVERRRHGEPISGGRFFHQADLFMRSVGAGYCDDVATVLHWIWRGLGHEARVVGLGGHVVPEIHFDGRWQLYDPDFAVFYYNRAGKVASVAELAADPSLMTDPSDPILSRDDVAYSGELAALYASTSDNLVEPYLSAAPVEPMNNMLTVPRGGYLELVSARDYVMPTIDPSVGVALVPLKLWFPPGYVGTVSLPLVLADISGNGRVGEIDVTAAGIAPYITAYYRAGPDVGITSLPIHRVGEGGLTLTMMVNPAYYKGSNFSASIQASDMANMSVSR